MKISKSISNYIQNNIFFILSVISCTLIILIHIYNIYLDNDQWFILREGKEIVENHNFYINTAFVLDGYKKVVQQWLYAVIIYIIYTYAGFKGLYLFVLLETFLFCILLYNLGKHLGGESKSIIAIIVLYLFCDDYISTRPELITWCLLLIQIIALEKYKKDADAKHLILLPILTLIESNIHAFLLVFHFLFIFAYMFPVIKIPMFNFSKRKYKIKPLIATNIAMLFTSIINPYSYKALTGMFETYKKTTSMYINEIQSPELLSFYSLVIVFGVFLTLYLVLKKEINAEHFYLEIGTCVLAINASRNISINGLAVFIIVINMISLLDKNLIDNLFRFLNTTKRKSSYLVFLLYIIPITLLLITTTENNKYKDCFTTPIKAIEYLNKNENNPENTKVYTDFNSGAYVVYNGYRGFMTPESSICQKPINGKSDYYDEYKELNYSIQNVNNFIDKYKFDYYICFVSSEKKVAAPMGLNYLYLENDRRFKKVVKGNGYVMYKTVLK